MQIGLCGFSGGGRSTLFTTLTGMEPSPPSGSLTHKSVGTVRVPEPRLDWLRELYQPKKFTPATVEFVDFAGIPRTAEKGKAELFAQIRESDALALVVSAFPDAADAIEVDGPPIARLKAIEEELLFADLEIVERRIERLEANLKKGILKTRDRDEREIVLMRRCHERLEKGESLVDVAKNKDEEEFLRTYRFLRQKPRIAIINAGEGQDTAGLVAEAKQEFSGPVFAVMGQVEAEIAAMAPEDRGDFLAEYGLETTASESVIAAAFQSTSSIPFFTVGEDECRAWVIEKGDTALIAAGKIHTDIQRGFIRAEVTPFEDVKRLGSMKAAKAENLQRLEGKEYVVQDGEIVHFRFSV